MLQFFRQDPLPLLLQSEAAECGLACLGMVAGYHGYRQDLPALRAQFPVSSRGLRLQELIDIAHRLQLSARPLKVTLESLPQVVMPAILHWDFNHFVVLYAIKGQRVTLYDPAQGKRCVSLAELSEHFTGVALELSPTPAFTPSQPSQPLRLMQLIQGLPRLKRQMAQILLLAAALQVFALMSPFFMQWVVDGAIVSADPSLLLVLGIGFLLLAWVQVLVNGIRAWVIMILSTHLAVHLHSRLFNHLLRLPVAFVHKRHLGDMLSRFDSLTSIQRTFTSGFIETLVDGLMVIATAVVMVIYSVKLSLIVLGATCLYALIRFALYPPLMRRTEEQIIQGAKQNSYLLETVRALQTIKLFTQEPQRQAAYHNVMINHCNAGIRVTQLNILFTACNGVLQGLENILVIALAALAAIQGGFSVGMLFAFIAYKRQFIGRTLGLIETLIELRMLKLHLHRVADIALPPPEPDTTQLGRQSESVASGDWVIRDLYFRYAPHEPYLFQGFNLTIRSGESVAITGPSGCGKSTLLKLLLGLLPYQQGSISLGGVDLTQIPAAQYRQWIGVVMQEDPLLAGSIRDNIAFFSSNPDMQWVRQCAQWAAIDADINRLPMGYNTLIGDSGAALSGGQKQRLLLARALYKRPKILVLDEATSHLDIDNERQVNAAIAQLGITRLMVAHRPQTLASADRIVDLSSLQGYSGPGWCDATGATALNLAAHSENANSHTSG